MSELTDLEIRKQITLILINDKFPKASSIEYDDRQFCFWVETSGFSSWPLENPLTDDALCFRFCYEDGISVHYVDCPAGSGMAYFANKNSKSTNYCDTPNRAVCLAKLNIFSE